MKRPTTYRVRGHWLKLWPQAGMNARFWLTVSRRVRQLRVRHKDREAIRAVCATVWAEMRA